MQDETREQRGDFPIDAEYVKKQAVLLFDEPIASQVEKLARRVQKLEGSRAVSHGVTNELLSELEKVLEKGREIQPSLSEISLLERSVRIAENEIPKNTPSPPSLREYTKPFDDIIALRAHEINETQLSDSVLIGSAFYETILRKEAEFWLLSNDELIEAYMEADAEMRGLGENRDVSIAFQVKIKEKIVAKFNQKFGEVTDVSDRLAQANTRASTELNQLETKIEGLPTQDLQGLIEQTQLLYQQMRDFCSDELMQAIDDAMKVFVSGSVNFLLQDLRNVLNGIRGFHTSSDLKNLKKQADTLRSIHSRMYGDLSELQKQISLDKLSELEVTIEMVGDAENKVLSPLINRLSLFSFEHVVLLERWLHMQGIQIDLQSLLQPDAFVGQIYKSKPEQLAQLQKVVPYLKPLPNVIKKYLHEYSQVSETFEEQLLSAHSPDSDLVNQLVEAAIVMGTREIAKVKVEQMIQELEAAVRGRQRTTSEVMPDLQSLLTKVTAAIVLVETESEKKSKQTTKQGDTAILEGGKVSPDSKVSVVGRNAQQVMNVGFETVENTRVDPARELVEKLHKAEDRLNASNQEYLKLLKTVKQMHLLLEEKGRSSDQLAERLKSFELQLRFDQLNYRTLELENEKLKREAETVLNQEKQRRKEQRFKEELLQRITTDNVRRYFTYGPNGEILLTNDFENIDVSAEYQRRNTLYADVSIIEHWPKEVGAEIVINFGRSELRDFDFQEETISRNHMLVVIKMTGPDMYEIRVVDAGSTNGTYVNNQLVSSDIAMSMVEGDELRLGKIPSRSTKRDNLAQDASATTFVRRGKYLIPTKFDRGPLFIYEGIDMARLMKERIIEVLSSNDYRRKQKLDAIQETAQGGNIITASTILYKIRMILGA